MKHIFCAKIYFYMFNNELGVFLENAPRNGSAELSSLRDSARSRIAK